MKIIEPSVQLINPPDYETVLETIEVAGRTCYKSEDKMNATSAEKFIKNILEKGHEAVIEHSSLTVKFICDRGVSHEIVRHRIASYCQESTRYCNYSKDKFGDEITVIRPNFFDKKYSYENNGKKTEYEIWSESCYEAEKAYFRLLDEGATAQEARSVLPNSLKTEVVMTANFREWRHFLRLRTSERAHPQMRQVAYMLADILAKRYPVVFEEFSKTTKAPVNDGEDSRAPYFASKMLFREEAMTACLKIVDNIRDYGKISIHKVIDILGVSDKEFDKKFGEFSLDKYGWDDPYVFAYRNITDPLTSYEATFVIKSAPKKIY